jgi:hypothetical protein
MIDKPFLKLRHKANPVKTKQRSLKNKKLILKQFEYMVQKVCSAAKLNVNEARIYFSIHDSVFFFVPIAEEVGAGVGIDDFGAE